MYWVCAWCVLIAIPVIEHSDIVIDLNANYQFGRSIVIFACDLKYFRNVLSKLLHHSILFITHKIRIGCRNSSDSNLFECSFNLLRPKTSKSSKYFHN